MKPGMTVKISRRFCDHSLKIGRMRFTVTKVFRDVIYMTGDDGVAYYANPNHLMVLGR